MAEEVTPATHPAPPIVAALRDMETRLTQHIARLERKVDEVVIRQDALVHHLQRDRAALGHVSEALHRIEMSLGRSSSPLPGFDDSEIHQQDTNDFAPGEKTPPRMRIAGLDEV